MLRHFSVLGVLAIVVTLLAQPGATTAQAVNPAVQRAVDQIRALPGETNFLVLENGREIGGYRPDLPLAGASQFKMFVARALKRQLEAGVLRYTDVFPLDPGWKAPDGQLYNWSDWAPMTVAT
jgi:hypothetical protein